MFERFTDRAVKVILLAQWEASRLGHGFCGSEVMLLGIIGERYDGASAGARVLKARGLELGPSRNEVEKVIGRGSGSPERIPFTPRAKRILLMSCEIADEAQQEKVDVDHILIALLREAKLNTAEKQGAASKVLSNLNIDLNDLYDDVVKACI